MIKRLLIAILTVGITGWWLGGFVVVAQGGANLHRYPVNWDGAPWIAVGTLPDPGYFREPVIVNTSPQQAILWIQADQSFSAEIDDITVGRANDSSLGGDLPARAIDVTQYLQPGRNILAVKVQNYAGRPPALRLRLVIQDDGATSVVTTGSPGWRASSELSQVRQRLSVATPQWSQVQFDDSSWPTPYVVPAPVPDGTSSVPQGAVEAPPTGLVIAAPNGTSNMVAATTLVAPEHPSDGWVRVGASGPYVIEVNGSEVATSATYNAVGTSSVPEQLHFYNLGPLLSAGTNLIQVHVTARGMAALYLDGSVDYPSGQSVELDTGPQWTVTRPTIAAGGEATTTTPAVTIGTAGAAWPQGIDEVASASSVLLPQSYMVTDLLITLVVVALWAAAAFVGARASRSSLVNALGLVGIANLPVLVLLAALNGVSVLSNVMPPFPFTPAMTLLVVVVLLLADALSALALSGAMGALLRGLRAALTVPDPTLAPRRLRPVQRVAHMAQRGSTWPDATAPPLGWWLPEWTAHPLARLGVGARALRIAAVLNRRLELVGICGIGALMGGLLSYRLDFDQVWQDEGTSISVAQGILAHHLPVLPSGLMYWKGELYHLLLAIVGSFTNFSFAPLRAISVGFFVLTVLAFGLFLLPQYIPWRWARMGLTLVFATAPMELAWAREIRMYQMAQFFTVLFAVVFLRALRRPTTANVAGSMGLLLAFYLSHEETFIILPAILVIFLASQRLRWIHNWRWWVFGGAAVAVVGGQALLTVVTHPPFLGSDISNRAFVSFDPNYIWGYINGVYFPLQRFGGSLLVISTLATLAVVVGIVTRNAARLYVGALFVIPLIMMSVVFSDKSTRYTFITLPFLFLLGGLGALDLLSFARRMLAGGAQRLRELWVRGVAVALTAALGIAWLMLSLTGGFSSYGLAASVLTSSPYQHGYFDYQNLYDYYKAHSRPSDVVISLMPSIILSLYIGREQDMGIDLPELLYLMDKNNQIVDTAYGKPVLLTTDAIKRELSKGQRIWLFASNSVFGQLSLAQRDLILADFSPVAETYSGTLYYWPG